MRVRRRPALIAVVCAVAVAGPSIALAAGVTAWPWLVAAAVVAAVVTVPAALALESAKRVSEHRERHADALADGCLRLAGRIPRVSEIDDPRLLGVHNARPDPSGPPRYVARAIDFELREALSHNGFVLVVGDSTAGKSRTAFEAIRTVFPRHRLLIPHDITAVTSAVTQAFRYRNCVLWLDDLERFLGSGGLTVERIADLVSRPGNRVIMATMRGAEHERCRRGQDFDRLNRGSAVLALAHELRLQRRLKPSERDNAARQRGDPRIAAALDNRAEVGLAEYLAAGPEALSAWHNAWDGGTDAHPRAAALLSAAVDCRRTGSFRLGVPRRMIEDLHEDYLTARGGELLRPESLAEAWAWLAKPVKSTARLAWSDRAEPDAIHVFDYLIDAVQRTESPLPDEFLLRIIEYPPSEHRLALIMVILHEGRFDLLAQVLRSFRRRPAELGPHGMIIATLLLNQHLDDQGRNEERAEFLSAAWEVTGTTEQAGEADRWGIGLLYYLLLHQLERTSDMREFLPELIRHPLAEDYLPDVVKTYLRPESP